TLHFLQLIESKARVGYGEHVARPRLLVNEDATAVTLHLFLHFQDSFALEHHGENETGRAVPRIVLFDQFAQQRFGVFLLNRLGPHRRDLERTLPVRDKTLATGRPLAELRRPAHYTNIESFVAGLFVEEQSVIRLFVGEQSAARAAGVCAGLDVPFNHENAVNTINGSDAEPLSSRWPRLQSHFLARGRENTCKPGRKNGETAAEWAGELERAKGFEPSTLTLAT